MRIGFIGLGDLGAPIAEQIATSDNALVVWNRTASRMSEFVEKGAEGAATPADLAERVDYVILCLTNAAAVEQVLFGSEGVASASKRPRLVIDHSTIRPKDASDFARRMGELGSGMIDAPVSGGAAGARSASLAVMVGGALEHCAQAEPIMASYAGNVTHMGPAGSGQAAKMCNQIVNFGTVAAIAEALATGSALGLDVDRLTQAMTGGLADSNMLAEYIRGRKTGEKAHMTFFIDTLAQSANGHDVSDARGRMTFPLKDISIAAALARETTGSGHLIRLVEAQFQAINGGMTGNDPG